MPIDPGIALSAVPRQQARPFDPFATLGDLAQLQNYRALMEERQARAAQEQRELQTQQDIMDLAQQYPDDHETFLNALHQRGYAEQATKFGKLFADERRARAEAFKSQNDAEESAVDAGLRVLQSVNDDATYQLVRPGIVQRAPELNAVLPQVYDPEGLSRVIQHGLSAKDWLGAQREAAQYVINDDTQNGIALLFSRADSQQKWELAHQLAKNAGAKSLAEGYGPQWSPEAQAKAAAQIAKAKAAEREGSPEQQLIDAWTVEHGRPPTVAERLALRKQWGQADDRPRMGTTVLPVVLQTAQGPQLLDKRTGTTAPIKDSQGQIVGQAPTAEMRNKAVARQLVGKSISAIEDLSKQIITKVGPAQRAAAIARGAEAVWGTDPQFRTYQDARKALAGNLAVAQQGSRPSDADILAIWLPLVPDAYRDTAESAAMKWDLIKTMSNVPTEGASTTQSTPGKTQKVGRFTVKVKE